MRRAGAIALFLVAALLARARTDEPRPAVPPAVLTPVEPAPERPRSIARRPWLWIAVGGAAVVIATGVTLGVVYGKPRDPTASWGVVPGN
jgi:hypothetical protein